MIFPLKLWLQTEPTGIKEFCFQGILNGSKPQGNFGNRGSFSRRIPSLTTTVPLFRSCVEKSHGSSSRRPKFQNSKTQSLLGAALEFFRSWNHKITESLDGLSGNHPIPGIIRSFPSPRLRGGIFSLLESKIPPEGMWERFGLR